MAFTPTTLTRPAFATDNELWGKTEAFYQKQQSKLAQKIATLEATQVDTTSADDIRRERLQFNDYVKAEGDRRRQALRNDETFVPNAPPAPISAETSAEQALLLAKRAKDFVRYDAYAAAAQKQFDRVIAARPELADS